MRNHDRHILFLNVSRTLIRHFPEMYSAKRLGKTCPGISTTEGIESLADLQPDLFLLDMEHEDQTDVWDRISLLKTQRATAAIPILLCVGAQQVLPWPKDDLYKLGIWLLFLPCTR